LRVWRLLIVVVEILAAAAGDARRSVESENGAGHVESVDAVVAQLARAVVPEPVPVVMEAIRVKRPLRRRTEPEIVIDARGHGSVLLTADGLPVAGNPAAGKRHLAELARANELGRAGHLGAAAPLRPHRPDAPVLAGRLDHAAALEQAV